MTLSAHKRSSKSDTRQNQLTKKAQTVLCAQKRCLPCHALVDLLSLGAAQLIQMHVSVPGGVHISWQSVPSWGETGRIPETNGFVSCRELSLQSPSEG